MCIKLFSSMGKVSQSCEVNTYNEIIFCVRFMISDLTVFITPHANVIFGQKLI